MFDLENLLALVLCLAPPILLVVYLAWLSRQVRVNCPGCGHQVSKGISPCPNCGQVIPESIGEAENRQETRKRA